MRDLAVLFIHLITTVARLAGPTLAMLPLGLPIWLAGLWYLFIDKKEERFRVLGWAWLVTAAVIMPLSPRIYYLFPAYPLLFAAGSVAWERWLSGVRGHWIKPVYVTLMVAMSALIAPTVIPLLPPETYVRYARGDASAAAAHRKSPTRTTTAVVRRSVRLGGDGGRSCGCVQLPGAGRPR